MRLQKIRLLIADEINPWPAESSADAIILDHARRAVRPWEATMLLREKGRKDAEPVGYGWDEAQAALQAGTHEVVTAGGDEASFEKEAEKPEDDGLDALPRSELVKLADERGLEVSAKATAEDIVKALRAAPAK